MRNPRTARSEGFQWAASIAFYRLVSADVEKNLVMTTTSGPSRRTIRRQQLREIVPLADSTIFEMEQRGQFPQRFYLTSRCVVWDLAEVEQWLDARRAASRTKSIKLAPTPNVRLRRSKPVRQ
jgi:prophage regulatory protein